MALNDKIDELLKAPCYVIDMLPQRVPKESEGQYFVVEDYFFNRPELEQLYQKFINILLKLNCYYDFQVNFHNGWKKNPSPKTLSAWVLECIQPGKDYMNILIESANVMLIVNGDDLYMSLYNPNENMSKLTKQLAHAEGLFLWKAQEEH